MALMGMDQLDQVDQVLRTRKPQSTREVMEYEAQTDELFDEHDPRWEDARDDDSLVDLWGALG
jgi:hypothetical protein